MSFKPNLNTLYDIYAGFEARSNALKKSAADITSEDAVGDDIGSLPGSENDKKVPEEMKKKDEEVNDETVGGAANYSGEGAEAGSDDKIVEPQLMEADEKVLTPDEKPLESDDYKAKTASVGNNLVSMILANQKKEAEAAKAKAEAQKQAAAKPAEQKQAAAKPAEAKKQAATAPVQKKVPAKEAASEDDTITLTNSILSKIAAVVLSCQEGREFVQMKLAEAAGDDFAKEAMDQLGLVGRQANEKTAEDAYYEAFMKGAQDASDAIEENQGYADAADLLGGGAGDGGLAPDAGAEGEGGEETMSDEELAAALDDLVERAREGNVTDEEAQVLTDAIEELVGEEGGDLGDLGEGGDDTGLEGADIGGDEGGEGGEGGDDAAAAALAGAGDEGDAGAGAAAGESNPEQELNPPVDEGADTEKKEAAAKCGKGKPVKKAAKPSAKPAMKRASAETLGRLNKAMERLHKVASLRK